MPSPSSNAIQDAHAKCHHETSSQASNIMPSSKAAPNAKSISSAGVMMCLAATTTCKKCKENGVLNMVSLVPPAGDNGKKGSIQKPGTSKKPFTLSESDSELSAIKSDGDEGASAIKASTHAAAQLAGSMQAVNGQYARFTQHFNGYMPEETLAELSKGWHSQVYQHFQDPIIMKGLNRAVVHRFTCKKYLSKHIDQMEYQESTENLLHHAKACNPNDTPEVKMITAYVNSVQYSPVCLHFFLVMWVACCHHAFQIMEDSEFQQILRMLYGKVQVPSHMTILRDVQEIHDMSKDNVIKLFKELPGKIHIAVDGWTSPNVISFLGVTAHWHKDGEINHIILDFLKLTSAHTADNLTEKLAGCFHEYGIEDKVLAIMSDNAKTNNAMMCQLKKVLLNSHGPEGHVQCFAHILSLVVKAVMSQFGWYKGKGLLCEVQDLHDLDDHDDGKGIRPGNEDASREAADDAAIEAMKEDHSELNINDDNVKLVQIALEKVVRLSQRVWYSPQIHVELARLASDVHINNEVLVHMVKTRWNTVAMVLQHAIELRPVLTDLCDMHRFNSDQSAHLRCYILTDKE